MFGSTLGEVWCKLLFNAMSVPFLMLLTLLIASQAMTARHYSEVESSGNPSELVGEVLF